MQIWPAIDLLGGKCVRLEQGDYRRETVYGDDPAGVARDFQRQGAEHLHLVDLDGARAGRPVNLDAVRAILSAVTIQCELGGGIRDEATIDSLLAMGLSRLVLGTSALKRPEWFRDMCSKHPGRLALGVDARGGLVATDGWLETSSVHAVDLVRQFADHPLAAIIYTDIATDGMLQGPNVAAMCEMQQAIDLPVIASGGVTTAEDVAKLTDAGLAGAIVGKALYVGTLTLRDALTAARSGAARAPT
jgi:phosphoribosylformimino-5-aminoimidazole carboxamide ribotide isomerase